MKIKFKPYIIIIIFILNLIYISNITWSLDKIEYEKDNKDFKVKIYKIFNPNNNIRIKYLRHSKIISLQLYQISKTELDIDKNEDLNYGVIKNISITSKYSKNKKHDDFLIQAVTIDISLQQCKRITYKYNKKKRIIAFWIKNIDINNSLSPIEKEISTFHKKSFVLDLHNDLIFHIFFKKTCDLKGPSYYSQMDIQKLNTGNVKGLFYAVWVSDYFTNTETRGQPSLNQFFVEYDEYRGYPDEIAKMLIEKLTDEFNNNKDTISLCKTYNDLENAIKNNKIAAFIGIEGAHPIHENLDNLKEFYDLGVRYIGLTWENTNHFATSHRFLDKKRGITKSGKKLLMKMKELGILVDLSHSSEKTFWDTAKIMGDNYPIIASHSDVKGLNDISRNISDKELLHLKKCGGIVGINFYSRYIKRGKRATIEDVLDQMDYIHELAGARIIALGSDFDGLIRTPINLENGTKYPNITFGLYNRGYTKKEIKLILGDNFKRVFEVISSSSKLKTKDIM